jgi:hypothetical protein
VHQWFNRHTRRNRDDDDDENNKKANMKLTSHIGLIPTLNR